MKVRIGEDGATGAGVQESPGREIGPELTTTPGVCGGEPCIAGTRIRPHVPADFVRAYREGGDSLDRAIERTREQYPTLGYRQILIAVAFEAGKRHALETSTAEQQLAAVRAAVCGEDCDG